MNRTQILERIAQLDKEINSKVDKNRVPRLNMKHRKFPLPAWIGAIVIGAIWVFGGALHQELHNQFKFYILILAALVALAALFQTFMWMFFGHRKMDKGYAGAMTEVAELQKERAALQKQLDNAK